MATLYNRMTETADRLVQRFGFTATLKTPGATTGPAYAPTAIAETTQSVKIAWTSFTARDVALSQVEATDRKAYLSVEGMNGPLSLRAKIDVGEANDLSIVRADPLGGSQQVVAYEIWLRG